MRYQSENPAFGSHSHKAIFQKNCSNFSPWGRICIYKLNKTSKTNKRNGPIKIIHAVYVLLLCCGLAVVDFAHIPQGYLADIRGPFHERLFHHNSNSTKISFCCHHIHGHHVTSHHIISYITGFNHGLPWCVKYMAPGPPVITKPDGEAERFCGDRRPDVFHTSRQAVIKTYHGTSIRQKYDNMI